MRRYRLGSKAIRALGHDEASRTLELEFISGAIYDYDGVPPEEVLAMLEATSRGKPDSLTNAGDDHIRGPYPYRRIA